MEILDAHHIVGREQILQLHIPHSSTIAICIQGSRFPIPLPAAWEALANAVASPPGASCGSRKSREGEDSYAPEHFRGSCPSEKDVAKFVAKFGGPLPLDTICCTLSKAISS